VHTAPREENGNLSVYEVSSHCRQPIIGTFSKAFLDLNILAFHEAGFVQSLSKSDQLNRLRLQTTMKNPPNCLLPRNRTLIGVNRMSALCH
jgi:hypothetical protein